MSITMGETETTRDRDNERQRERDNERFKTGKYPDSFTDYDQFNENLLYTLKNRDTVKMHF